MGFFDDLLGGSNSDTQDYLKQALAQYANVNVPTTAEEEVNNIPQETVQGTINPEKINTTDQGPTSYNDISLDPSSRAAQEAALNSYTDIANAGGLDANAKLSLQQTIDAAKEEDQGAQGSIMDSARSTGQGGGDFALTQRAIASQGASNNAATQGMQAAAEAEANREAALNAMSSIGSNIENADYSQASGKAAAQDTINAANTSAKNTATTNNVTNDLNAQGANVGNAQAVNAANTTAGQTNAYYNAGLAQQNFNDALAKANGAAGVNENQASTAAAANASNAAGLGKVLGAAGTIGATALGGPVAGAVAGSALNSGAIPLTKTQTGKGTAGVAGGMANGGITCYAQGGISSRHDHEGICMKMGAVVPGHAKVEGDSKMNDTVPAMLSPGELVIPRSVPKDGKHMEEFAKKAPVPGTSKKIDLTSFTSGYKRGKK